ncbi:MAG TPA: hypothetical protein VEB20_10420 [Azospirillaceae bacterium]|nr:hypothetical protein [Azospirillaceae bacterium]
MNQASHIIDKFGGITPLARRLNKPITTVQKWKTSGFIPARHQQDVLDAAREDGLSLTPADFFDIPAPAADCAGAG